MTDRYVKAASNKLYGDVADLANVDILNRVELSDGGAWVAARIWVFDDELEPESPSAPADAGESPTPPSVWISEYDSENSTWLPWERWWPSQHGLTHQDCTATMWHAHNMAHKIRTIYHASYVAVRPDENPPPLNVNDHI